MSDSPPQLEAAAQPSRLLVLAGKREGRGHRKAGTPCQDAYAVHQDPALGRAVVAVADGLGSRPLSHFGSQAACHAAVASLAAEADWDEAALRRAFEAARAAVVAAAAERGLAPDDLATTLQLAGLAGSRAVAAMVGDGAVVCATSGEPAVLLEPAESEYANVVVPLTADAWLDSFRTASRDGIDAVLLFTDGLTRLLLRRSRKEWIPFAPFFSSFLPSLATSDGLGAVDRLLGSAAVDQAWDDDKCLGVMAHAGSPA